MRFSRQLGKISFLFIFVIVTSIGCISNNPTVIPITATKDFATPESTLEITAPIKTEETESTPHVSPYIDVPIEAIEIQYLDSDRTQVNLLIHGTLPDRCKYDFYSMEKRDQNSIKIVLKGIHPPDFSCSRTAQPIVYELLLGKDLPESQRGFSAGKYEVTVNDFQTSFTVE